MRMNTTAITAKPLGNKQSIKQAISSTQRTSGSGALAIEWTRAFANADVGIPDGPIAEPLARLIADKRSGREVTRVTTTEPFR
jgi:hypothetical protein